MYPKSKRCTICGINYPVFVAQCRVAECQETTWPLLNDDPDEDWQEQVARRNSNEELVSPYPHPPDARARIYRDENERLWVTHAELLHVGYRNLTDDSIIFVNGSFYELQGYAGAAGAWWLEEVVVDGAADSLEPGMFDAQD